MAGEGRGNFKGGKCVVEKSENGQKANEGRKGTAGNRGASQSNGNKGRGNTRKRLNPSQINHKER